MNVFGNNALVIYLGKGKEMKIEFNHPWPRI